MLNEEVPRRNQRFAMLFCPFLLHVYTFITLKLSSILSKFSPLFKTLMDLLSSGVFFKIYVSIFFSSFPSVNSVLPTFFYRDEFREKVRIHMHIKLFFLLVVTAFDRPWKFIGRSYKTLITSRSFSIVQWQSVKIQFMIFHVFIVSERRWPFWKRFVFK